MIKSFACLALVFSISSPLLAQGVVSSASDELSLLPLPGGIVSSTVTDNQVRLAVGLPGDRAADLTITFERAVGLSLANLGLSAQLVSLLDLNLLARLPALGGGSIPAGFPVLLRIEPPASGGLSFSGIVSIELHTHNLTFINPCPLRLFAAPLGGRFNDITESMGMGSYRVRGTKGGFSEFLILADLRSVDQVILQKFDRLEAILDERGASIPGPVLGELTGLLQAARTHYASGAILAAIQDVEAFSAKVQQHSGTGIPDVWRSARDLVNVAGILRSAAGTLRFSLNLKAAQSP
jgi:hypothetical protein